MFSWLITIYNYISLFIQNGQVFFWAYLKQGVFAKGLSLDKLESRGNGMASSFAFSIFVVRGITVPSVHVLFLDQRVLRTTIVKSSCF